MSVFEKNNANRMALAKQRPMKYHENILVFYNGKTTFNKIMEERSDIGKERLRNSGKILNGKKSRGNHVSKDKLAGIYSEYDINLVNPSSVIKIKSVPNCNGTKLHPTQKPISLFEYLIKTYTNEGEIVLDNCAGSGTTAIACLNTNRQFIVMEKEPKYYDIIIKRIAEHTNQLTLF